MPASVDCGTSSSTYVCIQDTSDLFRINSVNQCRIIYVLAYFTQATLAGADISCRRVSVRLSQVGVL